MAEIIINQKQFEFINRKIEEDINLQLAKSNWAKLTEQEKKFVIALVEIKSPKNAKLLQEKWYNTVMDVLGLVDPTPIVDTINAVSYFSQGETLFGVLTLIAAVPGYVGDVVTKPVVGALKVGSAGTKELKAALDLAKLGKTSEAVSKLNILAKEPGVVGKFLRTGGEWAPKVMSWIDRIPAGPFKGLKNTIRDYFALLANASKKSINFEKKVKALLKVPSAANMQKSIPILQKYLKDTRIFKTADITKPGFFSQVFFGGIPRLFRSKEGRGIKILMGKTKFWLGFLDYIGIGNWVGPEELSQKLGGDEALARKLEDYQKTPQAKQFYDEDFKDESTQTQQPETQSPETSDSSDKIGGFFKSLFSNQAMKSALVAL